MTLPDRVREFMAEVMADTGDTRVLLLCALADMANELEPEQALVMARFFVDQLSTANEQERSIALSSVDDMVAKWRTHPAFREFVAGLENELGLLLIGTRSPKLRIRAARSLSDLTQWSGPTQNPHRPRRQELRTVSSLGTALLSSGL